MYIITKSHISSMLGFNGSLMDFNGGYNEDLMDFNGGYNEDLMAINGETKTRN